MPIQLILVDADDTLWHNMRHFDAAERAFSEMLAPLADAGIARAALSKVEDRNLAHYGYGAKSFTLSMIEAAIELGGDALPISTVHDILAAGRALLAHPVELLEGVGDTIEQLSALGDLVLLTKGDLLHQEMKLAASGLGEFFASVEIVSDKKADTFRRLFSMRGVDPWRGIRCVPTSFRHWRREPGLHSSRRNWRGVTSTPPNPSAMRGIGGWHGSQICPR
jgi:putative hydrolase of the HAD superfamily